MLRDLDALTRGPFELAVIGGGMFRAGAALDAAQRGLKVALVERGDFCGATSAHSYKMLHGGIRYLQHGDVVRIRSSAAARAAFLRVAPPPPPPRRPPPRFPPRRPPPRPPAADRRAHLRRRHAGQAGPARGHARLR